MRARVLSLILALSVLVACDPGTREPEYFPLNKGQTWRYRLVTNNALGHTESKLSFEMLGASVIGDRDSPTKLSSNGTRYYFDVNERGVFRIAKRVVSDAGPAMDPSPRTVLLQPLEVGTNWTTPSHPFVLTRMIPMGIDAKHTVTLNMQYAITAIDATVTVPAGKFTDCIKVVGEASYDLYADGRQGIVSIPITTQEWYAPNVGLVKLVRSENIESDIVTGGVAVLELVAVDF